MSALIPRCASCGRPMPSLLEAISLKIAVCSGCFSPTHRLIDEPLPVETPDIFDPPVKKAISDLISCRNERVMNLATSALDLAIKRADNNGFFQDPAGIIKEAYRILFSRQLPDYNLRQRTRKLLDTQGLWESIGAQNKGKRGAQNQVRLGAKVRQVILSP